jgi:integrase
MIRYAIGVLLAFDAYLRSGELVGLRREDFATAGDLRLGGGTYRAALRLRSTKTGPEQWAEIRDETVTSLLQILADSTPAGGLLFPFSTSSFRYYFKRACTGLGLKANYVPHSLRHGGATRDFLNGVTLEEILRRGRWASTKSARHYIQAGRAILLSVEVPSVLAAAGSTLAADLPLALELALTQRH